VKRMKKLAGLMAVVTILILTASPVLAASLGISPARVTVDVPADGSATVDFRVHYFTGEVRVKLVDIPLKVTPETLDVDASGGPVPVQLTIYGDASLGSRIYTGYVNFTGISGGMVNVAIQAKATVTNRVAGEEPIPVETPAAATTPQETLLQAESNATPNASLSESESKSSVSVEDIPLNLIIMIAAGVVFLGLVILAISLARRRH
jgi:hypothetical protein